MATAKDKAKEEKILQLRKAGAKSLARTELERLEIGIELDFGEEKIQINCKIRDSSVMRLRTDYRNFMDGASNIFRFTVTGQAVDCQDSEAAGLSFHDRISFRKDSEILCRDIGETCGDGPMD